MRTLVLKAMLFGLFTQTSLAWSEEVVERPDYWSKWYVTIVYDNPMSTKSQQLHSFVRTSKSFIDFQKQTIFNEWNDKNFIIQQTDWEIFLGKARPAILIQQPAKANGTGKVVCFLVGDQITCDKNMMIHIKNALEENQQCPDGRCPLPRRPRPTEPEIPNEPPAEPTPIPPTIITEPIDTPNESKEEEGIPLLILLLPVAAGLAGAYFGFDHNN